jgi:hypothetical protein
VSLGSRAPFVVHVIMLETQPLLGGPIKDATRTVVIVASIVALVVGVIIGTTSLSSFLCPHETLMGGDVEDKA